MIDDLSRYEGMDMRGPSRPAVKSKGKRPKGKPSSRFRLMVRFWQHPATAELSHAAKAAWCYLWTLADGARTCYPSKRRISRRLGCSERYVKNLVAELVGTGFLSVLKRGSNQGQKRANTYQIRLPGASGEGGTIVSKRGEL